MEADPGSMGKLGIYSLMEGIGRLIWDFGSIFLGLAMGY